MNIKFSPPDITEAEIEEVAAALRSGWITTGPKTKEFERRIAEYCNTQKAVCLNSATACMENALRALGVGVGDEVITSAYTYTASASVIDHVGAKIVLVDTAPGSYQMDYNAAAAAVTDRTKAIIAVDVAGVPCDYDRLFSIADSNRSKFTARGELQEALGRIAIIDDAAHSFGAVYKGSRVGQIADFTSFSFHAVKNLTTAEGGALLWRGIDGVDDERLYKELMLWSLHGQSKDALSKNKPGAWEYDIVKLGHKNNMTDIMAGIGLAQLNRYEAMLERRKAVYDRYLETLKGHGINIIEHFGADYSSSLHLMLTRAKGLSEKERNSVIENMASRGIAVNVHYKPLPMFTAYKALGFDVENYPNAYEMYKNEITLPLHTLLTDEEVDYIAQSYISALSEI